MYRVYHRATVESLLAAIRRLWNGCSECGRRIQKDRRQVYPHAKTCSPKCASRRERRLATERQRRFRKRRKHEQRHKENAQ